MSLSDLRSKISFVSQSPHLYSRMSIRDNIGIGCIKNYRNNKEEENGETSSSSMDIGFSQCDIERAAKIANAHDFIMSFPEGYDTIVSK